MDCQDDNATVPRGDVNPKKLILAAADYAENNTTQPPPELSLGWTFERWGVQAYGADVPAVLLYRAATLLNVYNAFASERMADNLVKWAEQYPMYADTVTRVRKMRNDAS